MNTDTISWNSSGWIKGNVGQKGFYRVNYDDANWDALANALKTDHKVGKVVKFNKVPTQDKYNCMNRLPLSHNQANAGPVSYNLIVET